MTKRENPETSPALAFFMSIFLPSMGQFYNKQYVKGVICLISFCSGILVFDYSAFFVYIIWISTGIDALLTSLYYRKQKKKTLEAYML